MLLQMVETHKETDVSVALDMGGQWNLRSGIINDLNTIAFPFGGTPSC